MSAPGAEIFLVLSAVLNSFIEKLELCALSLSSVIICSKVMSIRGSFSLLLLINSLEYNWSLLILTYSFVSISAFCLLSVYLMLFAISVFVRVKGLP